MTSRPSRAVRDAERGRNQLLFGLPIGSAPPPPVVVFWLHALNNQRFISREGAYSIAAAHNEMAEEALQIPRALLRWDYLVWLEVDHTFNAPDVFHFFERLDPKRYPIVGLLYVERQMPCLPVGFDKAADGSFARWDEARMAEFERRPGLYQVTGGVPMGVTAIHRSVFEKVPKPWFYDPPDGSMSDDIWFCQQAIAAGFPVHVATQFMVKHWGMAGYDRRHYWAGREFDAAKVPLLAQELLQRRIGENGGETEAGPTTSPAAAPGPDRDREGEGGGPEPAFRHVEKRRVTA